MALQKNDTCERRADRRPVPLLPPGAPLWFPPSEAGRDSGLVAAGGDLSVERLLLAYANGLFPWYDSETPILWWSPDPRCVLFPGELHISRSLRRTLNSRKYEISFNKNFSAVIRQCAAVPRPGQNGTWILPEVVDAYERLHHAGHAISAEAWENGELAGGIYGILMGKVFFGESMFHLRPGASKAALAALVRHLAEAGVELVDCQQATPHMVRFGAREITREKFLRLVRTLTAS